MQANSRAKTGTTRENNVPWAAPVLFPGSLGSATLVENRGGSFNWDFAVRPRKRPRLEPRLDLKNVFPDSRPPPIQQSSLSLTQRAEQGAYFLRTYHPDVDIPFDLIHAELDNAAAYPQSDHVSGGFDPLIGERLVVTDDPRLQGQSSNSATIIFPGGEVGQNLNISRFTRGAGQDETSYSTSPAMNFSTEIMQISLSSYASPSSTRYIGTPLLAVRTLASVSFVKFQRVPSGLDVPAVYKVYELRWSALGSGSNRVVTDVALSPFEANASLVVTARGSVHRIYLDSREISIDHILHDPAKLSEFEQESPFWKIAWGESGSSMFMAGEKCVKHFDLRQPSSSVTDIFRLDQTYAPGFITAIQGPPSDLDSHLLCVTTTDRITWIDPRFPQKSVLTWRHKRDVDRTLKATRVSVGDMPMTFLTSRSNALISIYDVQQEADGEIFSYGDPYELRLSPKTSTTRASCLRSGLALLPHSSDSRSLKDGQGAVLDLFELSSRGGISYQELRYTDPSQPSKALRVANASVAKTTDMNTMPAIRNAMVPVADREETVVNLSGLYKLLHVPPELTVNGDQYEHQQAMEILDGMPRVWQDSDEPLEHPLTTFDLAFRAGNEPLRPGRADFLNRSALRYDLLRRDRTLPFDDIAKGAVWSFDMTPLMKKLDDELPVPSPDTSLSHSSVLLPSESFAAFNCLPGFESAIDDSPHLAAATAASSKREKDAVETLALDLSLSRHMFAIRRPVPPQGVQAEGEGDVDVADALSHATQSLSIADKGPPSARFGYFRPKFVGVDVGNMSSEMGKDSEQPLGARLLLTEWSVGENVDTYKYTDPYNSEAARTSVGRLSQTGASSQQSRPRQLASTSSQVPVLSSFATTSSQASTRLPPALQSFAPLRLSNASAVPNKYSVSQQPFSRLHTSSRGRVQIGEGSASQDPGLGPDMDIDFDETEAMTNTQVLPGRYGGRPVAPSGKKIVKKRVGGF